MKNQTITRASIAKVASEKIGLSQHLSSEMLESLLDMIICELCNEQPVKLSTFGSFIVRRKKQRMGRNPRTGIDALIQARKVISFRPSHTLRMTINGNSSTRPTARSKINRPTMVESRA